MNIINYIKSLFAPKEPVRNFGCIISDLKQPVVEQAEVVAKVALPTFKGINGDNSIRKFPYIFQDGSSSCVAHTCSKIATVLYFLLKQNIIKYSAGFFYTQRANKPNEGMSINDITAISSMKGCLLYDLMPCDGYSEALINALKVEQYQFDSADAFKLPSNWIACPLDFNTVASTIEATKKPIMLWFTFGSGEFFYTQYPKNQGSNNPWVHSTCATDTTTINGIKYIVIEESADDVNNYQKFISEDFFIAKCLLAQYPKNFQFAIPATTKPVFDGTTLSLQNVLIYEGLLPTDCNTGYFGNMTKQALIKFQIAHSISPALGNFGDITKQYLLANYQ